MTHPRSLRPWRGTVLAAALLLAACDAPQLLEPNASPGGGPRADAAPAAIGGYSIPVPPNNGAPGAWYETGIQITQPGWVYIRVDGGVTQTANSECIYDGLSCGGDLAGVTSGPVADRGSGFVSLGFQWSDGYRSETYLDT